MGKKDRKDLKYTTSGAYITYWLYFSMFVIFLPWEFIQLARRRAGNSSAQTASQWISDRIEISRGWAWFSAVTTFVLWAVMTWVFFGHWGHFCTLFDVLCWDR